MLTSNTDFDKTTLMNQATVFTLLTDSEKKLLAPFFKVIFFKQDDYILKQGDKSPGLYILSSGAINVRLTLPGNYPKTIATLYPPECFGEISLIENSCASASIIAAAPSQCLLLTATDFRALYRVYPDTMFKVCDMIQTIITTRLTDNIKIIEHYNKELIPYQAMLDNVTIKEDKVTADYLKNSGMDLVINNMKKIKEYNKEEIKLLLSQMYYLELPKNCTLSEELGVCIVVQGAVHALLHQDSINSIPLLLFYPGKFLNFELYHFKTPIKFVTSEQSILFYLPTTNLNKISSEYSNIFYQLYLDTLVSLVQLFKATNQVLGRIQCQI